MWSSSNSPIASRRLLLLALALWPYAPLLADDNELVRGLRRWGRGRFRRFGLAIYDATLWGGEDPTRPPLVLRLDYLRRIDGRAIAEASVSEMRKLGASEPQLRRWGVELFRLFPDVRAGDDITGVWRPEGASFFHNGRPLGELAEPAFADRFFAIWLDPRTSAPDLRAALLGRPED